MTSNSQESFHSCEDHSASYYFGVLRCSAVRFTGTRTSEDWLKRQDFHLASLYPKILLSWVRWNPVLSQSPLSIGSSQSSEPLLFKHVGLKPSYSHFFSNLQKANSDWDWKSKFWLRFRDAGALLQIFITQGSKIINSKGLLSSHRFDATSVNPLLRLSVSWQSQGRQTPNISLIPTALTMSTLEQGIQDALELGCKCWAQSLLLWEVLNSTKSLQEATSKVQAARKTDLILNQYLSIWQDWNWFQLRIILSPLQWFSVLFWTQVWVEEN